MMIDTDATTFNFAWVLSGILLIPYLFWGIYLLRQRLVYHAELDRAVELFTIAALVFFFIFEFTLLKMYLGNSPVKLVFSTLGLVASALALYGPLLISFGSHLMVDLVMPSAEFDPSVPQYGAAAGCELRGDFEAAAREYATIARMFPKDSHAPLRAADNFMKNDELELALPYFLQGLKNVRSSSEALRVTNRLFEIYRRNLDDKAKAKSVLEEYLKRFPDAEYAGSVRNRLERLDSESRDEIESEREAADN
ncbi:MAG: hypothetical protein AMXMBFR82_34160 [Candidatus Hydrogenedentota bacterium]